MNLCYGSTSCNKCWPFSYEPNPLYTLFQSPSCCTCIQFLLLPLPSGPCMYHCQPLAHWSSLQVLTLCSQTFPLHTSQPPMSPPPHTPRPPHSPLWFSQSFPPSAHLLRVLIVQNTSFQVFKCFRSAHLWHSSLWILMFRISPRVPFARLLVYSRLYFPLNTSILRLVIFEACNILLTPSFGWIYK